GDAGDARHREHTMREVAADPVLGRDATAAPGPGSGAGVAGDAVLAGAVSDAAAVGAVVERRVLVRRAPPAGRRRRTLALVAGYTARRRRAAGEVQLPTAPGTERAGRVTGDAV